MKVIGAVGKNGTGKDEVLKYLKEAFGVPFLSTGNLVREIAAAEGLEPTRENLGILSERYFHEMGEGCFVRLLADKIILEQPAVVGISGIRSLKDVTILKEAFGNDFVLVCVEVSDLRKRFERMTARDEARDPRSFEQFMDQEKKEEEIFHIEEASRRADVIINNDETLA
ncbi:MAG: AAA family ATPase, partial [Syntrophales bacterium]|nr:AAA family ATPase [Syntrophales bacterium]